MATKKTEPKIENPKQRNSLEKGISSTENSVKKKFSEKSKIFGATKPKKVTDLVRIEKEFIIPLREKCRVVPRYKKTPKAIKTIKKFLVRHMKVYDRDLNKIKIDKYLNEAVWFRGIKKPPIKIKIRAIKDGDIVRAELVEMPDKLKFKKLREEKREKKAIEVVKKKKIEEKPEEEVKQEKTEEEKREEKEKVEAGAEATKQIEKAAAKQMKHQAGGKTKQPKRQKRVALQK